MQRCPHCNGPMPSSGVCSPCIGRAIAKNIVVPCARCSGQTIIGGSCSACDGQPQIVPADFAQALANAVGPRRRDNRRVNQYGGKGVIQYQPPQNQNGIQQTITLVDWQSPDGVPEQVTVEWGRFDNGGGGVFPLGVDKATGKYLGYRGVAAIYISSPSTTEDIFYADIGRGQKFVTSCSRVSVTLQMNAPPAGYLSGSMGVFATLNEGTSPTLAPVVFTQFVDTLVSSSGSNTATVIVPARANFLLPVLCSGTQNASQIDMLDNAGQIINSIVFGNGQLATPIPFSQDVYSLTLTNNGPLSANYRLVYQLSV